MSKLNQPEVWLRGPVNGIPALLQPVAHALLQAREEAIDLLTDFPDDSLWQMPANVASVGFHLQHLAGVLDRLFAYARDESLSDAQLQSLSLEGKPFPEITVHRLLKLFSHMVDKSLVQLAGVNEATLLETRGVGRSQIPSTVLGLLFHAAEHTMRHVGQMHVTIKVIKASVKDERET